MITARMARKKTNESVDMTHVVPGDCFIKIIDANTIAHLVVEEVISESRFSVRLLDAEGLRTGNAYPMSALELSRLHSNIPANKHLDHPKVVNG